MTSPQTPSTQTGITVSTTIAAGVGSTNGGIWKFNHAEGIVVSTAISAGPGSGGVWLNHAEGVVVSTELSAGGWSLNHTEGIVAR